MCEEGMTLTQAGFRQSQYCTPPSLVRSVCTYQSGCALELPLVLFNPIASSNQI